MQAQDFLDWTEIVQARFAADIVRLLGIERSTAQAWLRMAKDGQSVPVRKPHAMAMAAAAHGLTEWGISAP